MGVAKSGLLNSFVVEGLTGIRFIGVQRRAYREIEAFNFVRYIVVLTGIRSRCFTKILQSLTCVTKRFYEHFPLLKVGFIVFMGYTDTLQSGIATEN